MYLFQLIPPNNNVYATRSFQCNKISSFKTRHNFSNNSLFLGVISEWNSLDKNIGNFSYINVLKKDLLKFIRPEPNSTYNTNDTKELKLLRRLRLRLSHLADQIFRHNFQDCVYRNNNSLPSSLLISWLSKENPLHKINEVSRIISRQSDSTITKILLFGDNKLDFEEKKILLRVYFINREIQLSLIWAKLNDSIVSFYSKIMKHLCFRLVTFFLHVKLYLLILVSGYSESLINLF